MVAPMHLKTSSIKGFLILCMLAGLTTFLLATVSFTREPIRTVTGTVTKVSDGDTIQVTTPEQTKLRVRIYGIDAPETPKINQSTGRVIKPATLWKGILEGSGRQNHSVEHLKEPYRVQFIRAEKEARSARRGSVRYQDMRGRMISGNDWRCGGVEGYS